MNNLEQMNHRVLKGPSPFWTYDHVKSHQTEREMGV
mgnify:CR=1 FL=1|jgi:hypothetical protein